MQPGDLSLPFSEWRQGQYELLTELACAPEPYILLEAPTGIGKSGLALGLGRLLATEHEQTVILVGTKQLQAQYADSLRITQAIGRGNFGCNVNHKKTAADALCTVGGKCPRKGTVDCSYYEQKLTAQASPEVVLNYPLWLAWANYAGAFNDPRLLICDEAHLLEDELRRFASATIRKSHIRLLGVGPSRATLDEWRKFAKWFLDKYGTEYRLIARGVESADDDEVDQIKAIKTVYEACRSLALGDADNWVLDEQPWGATFKPVWVAPFVKSLILRHSSKIVFMSATILDKDLFCRQLGIPAEKTRFIRAESTFPRANRPLYYQPVGRVKMADPLTLDKLVAAIDDILDAHPGEHGLIHTVSYRLAEYIKDESRHSARLFTHDTKTRADTIHRFQDTPAAVLVSPSVTTGVDLPYDACSFQIIAKLAFPDLTDRQIKKRMKNGPGGQPNKKGQDWYNWATACSLVQAYGRGMRAPDDNCKTYLLDGNWDWFRHSVKDMLPRWFLEAITKTYPAGSTYTVDAMLAELKTRGKIPA